MAAGRPFYRPLVRPWALAAPIIVLLICVPTLRPLRHPSDLSVDETLRLATVQALLDHGTLALGTPAVPQSPELLHSMIRAHDRLYSEQPPVMALILAAITWLLERLHLSIRHDPASSAYILTLLTVTMPVALGAGVVYRMGRALELPRHWRSALALATVLASGLISYAVVLNAYAPAGALLLISAAMLLQVDAGPKPAPTFRRGVWLLISGAAAALAAVLDPPAAIAGAFILAASAATSFGGRARGAGILFFMIGAGPFLILHAAWNIPITGDMLPGNFHRELSAITTTDPPADTIRTASPDLDGEEPASSAWQSFAGTCAWLYEALVGSHGLLSHFPLMILGVGGVGAVMHRHWPAHLKLLAAGSLISGIVIVGGYCWVRADWRGAMFGCQWFVCFMPLLTFWAGAWLKRPHPRWAWIFAGLLLAYSAAMALSGLARSPDRGGPGMPAELVSIERTGDFLTPAQPHR